MTSQRNKTFRAALTKLRELRRNYMAGTGTTIPFIYEVVEPMSSKGAEQNLLAVRLVDQNGEPYADGRLYEYVEFRPSRTRRPKFGIRWLGQTP